MLEWLLLVTAKTVGKSIFFKTGFWVVPTGKTVAKVQKCSTDGQCTMTDGQKSVAKRHT
jgi:hypothetical protein